MNLEKELHAALVAGALPLPDACRAIRSRDGLTQAEFARRAGVALKVVKQLESGKGNPTLDSLNRIAALGGLRIGLLKQASTVRFDSANAAAAKQAKARRVRFRALEAGRTSLRKEHRRNALAGTDFTIDLVDSDLQANTNFSRRARLRGRGWRS